MNEYFYLLYPFFYSIVLAVGFFNLNKIKDSKALKLFLFFIFYSFVTEISAYFISFYYNFPSFFIYNIWNLVNNYFFLFFFLKILKKGRNKKIVAVLILTYTFISIIDISFFTSFIRSNMDYNIVIGSILIVTTVLIYLAEKLLDDTVLNLNKSMYFWISIGVLLFNIGFIPVYAIANYIGYNGVFDIITLLLNVLMIGCFITGFIVSKKEFNN